ncbi:histone-like nucleoid-structuring protein Lsr2 [Microbacterium sp.]|uniref:histone-like nucleoid-structuring protein Lsr2 n=1 Tax=Microbacterium sp. TaxID=51671 RepID=UPI0039E45DB0
MARRIVHQLVDDLDGTLLDTGAGETVRFSLDGVAYEIDLTEEHAAALRDAFAPYVAAGRSVSSRPAARGSRTQRRAGQRDYGPVRAWAAENGYSLSSRGRIPASVLEAYDAAH